MAKTIKIDKTNALRIVEQAGVTFETRSYTIEDDHIDGVSVAAKIGADVEQVFKTLVARGADHNIYVFVIPVAETLNLKAAAQVAGVKKMEMIHVREITPLTGYIRGGCSPIGMKKQYKTYIDETCEMFDQIIVSAGKIGLQLVIAPQDLARLTQGTIDNLT